MPGVDRLTVDLFVEAAKQARDLGIPGHRDLPRDRSRQEDARRARGLQSRWPGLPRHHRGEEARAGHRRRLRRGARPVQQRRPRRHRARRLRAERRIAGSPGQAGDRADRGRRRHPGAVRHDGRPHRRHPQGARRQGLHPRPDHELRRQVRLGLLQPLPRRHRQLGRAQGRQEDLPDGLRQFRRGAARGRPRHRGRRRHGDGQARPALSRHRAPREGLLRRADLRLPGERRVLDAERRRRPRLARLGQGADRDPDRLQARRLRRHPDLRRCRCREVAEGK